MFAQEIILARVGIGLKAGCDYTAPLVNPYKIKKIDDVSRVMMSALADIDEYAAVMDMFCEWWARKLQDIQQSSSTGKSLGWLAKTMVERQTKKTPMDRLAWYHKKKAIMEEEHLEECRRVSVSLGAVAASAKKKKSESLGAVAASVKKKQSRSKLGSV